MNTRAAALTLVGILGLSALSGCASSHKSSAGSSDSASAPTPAGTWPASPSPSDSGSPSASASSAGVVITIKHFTYGGGTSVPAGAAVTVTNHDSVAHTVTSDAAGVFDVKIDPGRSATFKAPAKAGAFPYHCTYHADMHGTMKVS